MSSFNRHTLGHALNQQACIGQITFTEVAGVFERAADSMHVAPASLVEYRLAIVMQHVVDSPALEQRLYRRLSD